MYQALYRRFRPQTFGKMLGQEHIVPILKNQVVSGRISHAYLFCGTRGTGKTSAAKIFARAVNCANPDNGEPCLTCDSCVHAGDDIDVIEIDAASNNGVDHIRDLREKVHFTPLHSRYKIYIIDEAHMLSSGAFNALLKTLEEPPEHIVFILATTEPQKLPVTILSRCQRFDFHRLSEKNISERLKSVLDSIGATYENEAISAIARVADGGMRDALSIADQCLSFLGDEITLEGVLDMLGSMDPGFVARAADACINSDAASLLRALDEVMAQGRDALLFARDLAMYLRSLLIIATCGEGARRILNEPEALEELSRQAGRCSAEQLLRNISILQRAEADAKWFSLPRPVLECALIQLCRIEDDKSLLALEARIATLEKAHAEGALERPTQKRETPAVEGEEPAKSKPKAKAAKQEEAPEDASPSAKDGNAVFEKLLTLLQKEAISIFMLAKNACKSTLSSEVLTLSFAKASSFYADSLAKESNKAIVQSMLAKIDPSLRIEFEKLDSSPPPQAKDFVSQAIELFGAEIVSVD